MVDVQDVKQKVLLKWSQEIQAERSSNVTNAIQISVWKISDCLLLLKCHPKLI